MIMNINEYILNRYILFINYTQYNIYYPLRFMKHLLVVLQAITDSINTSKLY